MIAPQPRAARAPLRLLHGALPALVACSEYQVREPDALPTAEAPAIPATIYGNPPDWQTCEPGFAGHYTNLTADEMGVAAPDTGVEDALDPTALDWWDPSRPSIADFDPSLDFGANWWPLDEGIEGDPAWFAVWWVAWLRVWDDTEASFTLGAATDAWVLLDDVQVAAQSGRTAFEPETVPLSLDGGQYPVIVYAAQRGGPASALRFRWLTGDVTLCYPDFSETVVD